ncbi:MAG: glycerol-3-phosphate dehydrogenase/oxidase [Chlamydiales bacterium]|nr:glycerol-3-phosphate dehydrogenase/oxidase [Chlamydiales bacterium]
MKRDISKLDQYFDVIIIGGGATGLGAGVDAAARGLNTLLLEGADFASGTSSRSTKLIHGGLRYLQQGDLGLVKEALHERGLLCQNAPHLVHHLGFIVPTYHFWESPFYGTGIKLYDFLAGKLGLEPSKHLSRSETLAAIPTLNPEHLRGGIVYYDGQFDDARLAITLARTLYDLGGCPLNYMRVENFTKQESLITGVIARDLQTNQTHTIRAKHIINATGIFTDQIRHLDDPLAKPVMRPSQGIHIVLPKAFLPSDKAILVPHTRDGRVLFMVPWHGRVLVGTTETPISEPVLEPKPLPEEIDFILEHTARYLTKAPTRADILSLFAGIRPLVADPSKETTGTLSRSHEIISSPSGLLTITGGKWTTYRKMGQDIIDKITDIPCPTEKLKLHGYALDLDPEDPWSPYGSDSTQLRALCCERPELETPLHRAFPHLSGEVIWAVRHEMALNLDDVLSRRMRLLLLDAKATLSIAEPVAQLMADELGQDSSWVQRQLRNLESLASIHYLAE